MSTYGKLWQEVAGIRDSLRTLLPGASIDTLASARVALTKRTATIDGLLARWARLEEEMEPLDEETGELP